MSESPTYRQQVRKTFQGFSDAALAFQDAIIVGGIDREECDREKMRRSRMDPTDRNVEDAQLSSRDV